MLVLGILGFVSIICLLVRQKWRNAVARKEEILRLVAMASEEAAMAEAESTVEYESISVAGRHQCAVCYRPTTTRCSQCKIVRYCSGKCQIIHWRQGHKDECHPPTTIQFNEGSDFGGKEALQKQPEVYGDDFEVEGKLKIPSQASSAIDDDNKVQPCADPNETHADDVAPNMNGTKASVGKMKITAMRPSKSTTIVNCIDSISSASKLNQMEPNHADEQVDFRFQSSKAEAVRSDDVWPTTSGNKKPTKELALSEKLVRDAAKFSSAPPLSCPPSDTVADDEVNDSQLSNHKEVRPLPSSASGDQSFSATRGHLILGSKFAKTDTVRALPEKVGSIPSLPQNACNGLKTSIQKVVKQFKASKQLKPHILGLGNEVTGTYDNKILFPYELFLQLYSLDKLELCPFGLVNCGNSCYANAVLQCLTYTRPLTSYLLQGLHSRTCRRREWCFLCEFECLILEASEGKSPLSPIRILSKIQKIGSRLSQGREEDAHEFLRYAVDTMQSICLKEAGVVGPLAEETTLVGLTFVGYLRSKIKCMRCLSKSEQYERMMDLTVEIDGDIGTLEEALSQYTATEILDRENKYYCSRCKSYEKAKKKLTVLEAPNILTIVLKRFESGNFGKLNKSVRFPEVLNMASYMSGTSDKSPVYSLYAVVVHLDIMNTALSGHYVCYVKNSWGKWFKINDSSVEPVELETVLLAGAYMLLYARQSPRAPASIRNYVVSHGGKLKKRNLEAVPSGLPTSKGRYHSKVPSRDPSPAQRKTGKHPDGPAINSAFDPVDWKLHSMQRIHMVDSSSESSSLFSCSDASSCSSTSTKDSAGTEDLTDYIFGNVGPSWYSRYGLSSDSCAAGDDVRRQGSSWVGNSGYLYTDTSKHSRNLTSQFDSSSSRETELEHLGWVNSYDAKSGVSLRRGSWDRSSAQTFY